jgi:hypothetical protein
VLCVCIMHHHTCVNTDLLVRNVGKIRLGALDVSCCNLKQRRWLLTAILRSRARWDSAVPLVLSTRVSTLGDDVAHGWDAAACAAGRDGDGIMLASAMAERALEQSLPAVAGAVLRAIPRCTLSAFLSSLAQTPTRKNLCRVRAVRISWELLAEKFSFLALPSTEHKNHFAIGCNSEPCRAERTNVKYD